MQPVGSRAERHRSVSQFISCMISVVSLARGECANLESIIKDCTCPTLLHYYSYTRENKTALKMFLDKEYHDMSDEHN